MSGRRLKTINCYHKCCIDEEKSSEDVAIKICPGSNMHGCDRYVIIVFNK